MKNISIKLDNPIYIEVNKSIKKYRYTTISEFIREAIREKLIKLKTSKFK